MSDYEDLREDREFQKDILLNDELKQSINPSVYNQSDQTQLPPAPKSTSQLGSNKMALPALISGVAGAGSSIWGSIFQAAGNVGSSALNSNANLQSAKEISAANRYSADKSLQNGQENRNWQKQMWEKEWKSAKSAGLFNPSQFSNLYSSSQGQFIGRRIAFGPRATEDSPFR